VLRVAALAVLLAALPTTRAAAAAEAFRSVAQAAQALATSPEPEQRARAAAWLSGAAGASDQAAARAALLAALADPVPAVRRLAAAALSKLPAATSRAGLERALRAETDREVAAALLLAVGALGDPATVPLVAGFARDPSPAVRAAAFTALGDAGGEEARRRLLAALRDPGGPDPGWLVRSAAVLGLARCGRRGDVGEVLAAVREQGGWSHWLARSALARAVPTLDPDPLPLLEHLVRDGDSRVAVTAAEGFVRCGRPDRLLALLDDPSPAVRGAAAGAVALAGLRDARARLAVLARRDPALAVRWAASLALFRMQAPEGEDLVLAALSSPEAAIWTEAAAVLEQRTGEQHGRDTQAWRGALKRAGPR
jgi:HEAT repeat protein